MLKHIYSTIALTSLAAIGVLWATNPVMAISVDFSFTSTGGTSGTATGIINGLTLNGTSTPTDIDVSASAIGIPDGTDLKSYVTGTITLDSNGNVTAVSSLKAYSDNNVYSLTLNAGNGQNSIYNNSGSGIDLTNSGGLAGVTYTSATSSVPWEGESALVPTISGAILIAMTRRTRVAHRQTDSNV